MMDRAGMTDEPIINTWASPVLDHMDFLARENEIERKVLPKGAEVACVDCPAGLWLWSKEAGKLTCFCKTFHRDMWDGQKGAIMLCDGRDQAIAALAPSSPVDQRP